MSLTNEERRLHLEYENANETVKRAVDDAYKAAWTAIAQTGMTTFPDDRAEQLVVAIYRYIIDCAE